EGRLHELVSRQRRVVGQAPTGPYRGLDRPIEATFAGDDDALGEVTQHGVGRAPERAPRARAAGPLGLLPDHLAPKQQVEVVLQDADDVGREAAVGLAPEVGQVYRDAAGGLELALAPGKAA